MSRTPLHPSFDDLILLVYLMYILQPLSAWRYFVQSSLTYQLYMKTTYGPTASSSSEILVSPDRYTTNVQRRLEESMYWSCFKSESEFRVELPLPVSEIATYQHPQLFPSPPSPAGGRILDEAGSESTTRSLTAAVPFATELDDIRQHAKQLCNEEESWYYYLTEIALRRIGNRIINTFFRQPPSSWLDVKPLLGIALEFDTQVSAWSAHLPTAMQHWETTYSIRAPNSTSFLDRSGSHVSRELSWATDNRLLEMRSWLYQPFLYFLIHGGTVIRQAPTDLRNLSSASPADDLSGEEAVALRQLIRSGVECNLRILDVRSLHHRHHGLWYDLRSLVTAALILLGVVKSGHEDWIPGGAALLWGSHANTSSTQSIGGKIGHALDQLEFWSAECPNLKRHRQVLEKLVQQVRTTRTASDRE